ncbi:LysR family transcriptional regulator substrate-binding protein [Achromobacter insuavis]
MKTQIQPTVVLAEQVSTGRLPAALTIAAHPPRGVLWLPLRSVRYRIALPTEHAAVLKRGGWREVAQLPWLDGPAGSHTHLLLRDMFERHGLSPRIAMQNDDQANLEALVRAGAGCAAARGHRAGRRGLGRLLVWGQARADAMLGFILPYERASGALVALSSIIQAIWKPRAQSPSPL